MTMERRWGVTWRDQEKQVHVRTTISGADFDAAVAAWRREHPTRTILNVYETTATGEVERICADCRHLEADWFFGSRCHRASVAVKEGNVVDGFRSVGDGPLLLCQSERRRPSVFWLAVARWLGAKRERCGPEGRFWAQKPRDLR